MLVRYSAITAVNYDPLLNAIRFTFLLSKEIKGNHFTKVERRVMESLDALWTIKGGQGVIVRFSRSSFKGITSIEMLRDMGTLSQEEISVLVQILQDEFDDCLVTDETEPLMEEDLLIQEELIQEMLEDVKNSCQQRGLVAIREEGRVIVYNQ